MSVPNVLNKRPLGRSGQYVTPLILGTWAMGGLMWGPRDEKNSLEAIRKSLDLGINAIDTAPLYGLGFSEELIGKAIKGRRDKIVIATKCGLRFDIQEGDPWRILDENNKPVTIYQNTRPHRILEEWEQSAKRLGVDVIDLYQIHWPDDATPIEESWEAMVRLKKEGKVRAIGVSNYSLEQLKKAHAIHPVDSLQPPYSLIRRDIEKDLVPFCRENNISLIVYSPLERGLLTGKIGLDHVFGKADHRATKPLFNPKNRAAVLERLELLRPLAEELKTSLSALIIATTISQPGITAALVGAKSAAQATENASALQLHLSDEQQKRVVDTFKGLHVDLD